MCFFEKKGLVCKPDLYVVIGAVFPATITVAGPAKFGDELLTESSGIRVHVPGPIGVTVDKSLMHFTGAEPIDRDVALATDEADNFDFCVFHTLPPKITSD